MSLVGNVVAAAPGVIGFDIATRLNMAQAKKYVSQGFAFCIRYVSRDDATRKANEKNGTPDLSLDEGQVILAAGMALMVVQHCPKPGWTPTAELGKTYGENAASYAATAGLPEGVNLWLDLEGIAKETPHQDIIDYCNAWFAAVRVGGYEPGVYLGFDIYLSSDELFFNLKTKHYWRAPGHVPDVAHRGYQLIQHIKNPGPTEFDWDVTRTDDLGDTVIWLAPNDVAIA